MMEGVAVSKSYWWEDHRNLAALWSYMRDALMTPDDPAEFMARPWLWHEQWVEYDQLQRELAGIMEVRR